MTVKQVCEQLETLECPNICITGGEPLSQKPCHDLMTRLCDFGYQVSLETSGALAIDDVDPRVIIVMDLKTPNSGEMVKNRLENIQQLKLTDQLKFVICNQRDYQWAVTKIKELKLDECCTILISPAWKQQDPAELAAWILEDKLNVRMQLQLHKLLWGDKQGV